MTSERDIVEKLKAESDYQKGYIQGSIHTIKRTIKACLLAGAALFWIFQHLGQAAWDYPPVKAAYTAFWNAIREGRQ